MEQQEKNIVQVYGIPRSGTNFVEWSLVNNFVNLEYKNIYGKKSEPFNFSITKHHYPSLEHSKFAIVIYKEFKASQESYKRWCGKTLNRKIYDEYLSRARALDPRKTIIFEHSWLVDNYQEGLKQISDKFGLKLKDKTTQPFNRMDKGGASAKQTNRKYQR